MSTAAERAGAYGLLARLIGQEVDASALASLRTEPELAQALPQADDATALAQLRAEWTRLCCIELSPYESVFLDDAVMLLTEATVTVEEAYRAAAYLPDPSWRVAAPDHAAVELAFLQALCAAEASIGDATSVEGPSDPHAARQARWRFLVEHAAAWLPSLALAARRNARLPFYPLVFDLAADLVLSDLAELAAPAGEPDASVPEVTEGVAGLAEGTLGDVATFLTTPARCGLFLSRADLSAAATALGIPLGVPTRRQGMRHLFEEGARFGVLPGVLSHIEQLVTTEHAAYADWAQRYPAALPVLLPYLTRLGRLRASLRQMREAAKTAPRVSAE